MPVNTKQSTTEFNEKITISKKEYEELKKETGCGDRLLFSALRTMALEERKKENEELKKENEELKKEFEDIMKNTSFVIKWDELLKGS